MLNYLLFHKSIIRTTRKKALTNLMKVHLHGDLLSLVKDILPSKSSPEESDTNIAKEQHGEHFAFPKENLIS